MYTIKFGKTIQTITLLALSCIASNINASNTQEFYTEVVTQYPSSSLLMGQIYEEDQGKIKKNLNKAQSYYLIAALENNIDAQLALGNLYLNKDKPLQSYLFFSIAANNGDSNALSLKQSISKQLTTQELALAPDFIDLITQVIKLNQLPLVSINMQ